VTTHVSQGLRNDHFKSKQVRWRAAADFRFAKSDDSMKEALSPLGSVGRQPRRDLCRFHFSLRSRSPGAPANLPRCHCDCARRVDSGEILNRIGECVGVSARVQLKGLLSAHRPTSPQQVTASGYFCLVYSRWGRSLGL
jgi:hypothetical protein